jgi:type IV secretory pathway VirB2 component (pilin)
MSFYSAYVIVCWQSSTLNSDYREKNMKVNFSQAFRLGLVMGISASLALAQSSPFGQVAQGTAIEFVAVAKWVGIILCIISGFAVMSGGPGVLAKLSGLILGLVLALFAGPIVSWVQSL